MKKRYNKIINTTKFFSQCIARPTTTGAIAPSSRALADMITSWTKLENAKVVVEFGPGTGVFTEVIRQKISPQTTFIAIEINQHFVDILKKKFPDVHIYNDCIENTHYYLEKHGFEECDCIISGLPWAAFNESLQERLLDVAYNILKPGGQFATFAYLQGMLLKSARRFRRKITSRFYEVSTSPMVWPNFPPAFVYQAVKQAQETSFTEEDGESSSPQTSKELRP